MKANFQVGIFKRTQRSQAVSRFLEDPLIRHLTKLTIRLFDAIKR